MQDFFQERELLAAFDAAEVLFRGEERSGGPTHDHSWSIPAFNLVGSVGGLRKAVLNEVGVGEDATEPGRKIEFLNGQGFFQAFQQAGGRHGPGGFLANDDSARVPDGW